MHNLVIVWEVYGELVLLPFGEQGEVFEKTGTGAGSIFKFLIPTSIPTAIPTTAPTRTPTVTPTVIPTAIPTAIPRKNIKS